MENVQKRLHGNVLPGAFFSVFFCLYVMHRSVARGVRDRAWLCAMSVQLKNKHSELRKGEGESGENMHSSNEN